VNQETRTSSTFVQRVLITCISLAVVIWAYPGISISNDNPLVIAIAALVLAAANATVRPLLIVLTLPVSCLTFGLFILVINGLVLRLAAWLIPPLEVSGYGIVGALLLSLVGGLINWLVGRD
jgi:putative membrane protein